MSLFASLGQGDIWALSGISFASPINDLLDKGEFSLEDLLEEDELIQEVKANNERLLSFISKEDSVERLLDFIVRPALPVESPQRVFRYPYMSCEVICCEVPEMLRILVEEAEGKYLVKLFSFLSDEPKLDYYLAGYFEKILEMLFRRMTIPMMKYFNDAGNSLLSKFLEHMDNYSVMQIVQRLMLPHIPFANIGDGDAVDLEENKEQNHCSWSYQLDSCQLLLDRMFDKGDPDVPLHISDLLITVLQLSPPETFVIQFLCNPECIQKLLEFAVISDADMVGAGDLFSAEASISLASISVLESLNSRLFESSLPYDHNMSSDTDTQGEAPVGHVKEKIDSICRELVSFLPRINASLRSYLDANPCAPFTAQNKALATRLGHRGLQLVKLIESIVRLCNSEADEALCHSGIFPTCMELFFKFANNSLLHLSVQRIIISILESEGVRNATQQYILTGFDLLPNVMKKVRYYHNADEMGVEEKQAVLTQEEQDCPIRPQHSSISGNLILIAQALSIALDANPENTENSEAAEANVDVASEKPMQLQDIESGFNQTQQTVSQPLASSAGAEILSTADGAARTAARESAPNADDAPRGEGERDQCASSGEQENTSSEGVLGDVEQNSGVTPAVALEANSGEEKEEGADIEDADGMMSLNLRSLVVEEQQLLSDWDKFVENTLRLVLDHQMVGSYQTTANLSAFSSSQDDALKLGVDLDLFRLDAAGGIGLDDEDDDDDIEVSTSHAPWAHAEHVSSFGNHFDPFGASAGVSAFDDAFVDTSSYSESSSRHMGENSEGLSEHPSNNFADFASFENVASGVVVGGDQSAFDSVADNPTAGADAFADSGDAFADFADFSEFGTTTLDPLRSDIQKLSLDSTDSKE